MTEPSLSAFPVVCPICGEQVDSPVDATADGFDVDALPLANHIAQHLPGEHDLN